MKQCLLVLGMHRSGTSALTGALEILGVDLGDNLLAGSSLSNEKGHFENTKLNDINVGILRTLGSDWDKVTFLEDEWWLREDIQKFKKPAKKLLRSFSDVFALKDPRTCLLMPFWKEVFAEENIEIKVLLPIRHPEGVANSLLKRDDFSKAKSYMLWMKHSIEAELNTRDVARCFTTYDELLSDTENLIKNMQEKLDIKLPYSFDEKRKELDEFLDVGLRHSNKNEFDKEYSIDLISKFYDEFLDCVNNGCDESKQEKLDSIARQYRTLCGVVLKELEGCEIHDKISMFRQVLNKIVGVDDIFHIEKIKKNFTFDFAKKYRIGMFLIKIIK